MKRVFIIAALSLPLAGLAQIPVTDFANLAQNLINYAAIVEQVAQEAEQVQNQVQQIKRADDQLKRLGDMSTYKSVVGFQELTFDLKTTSHAHSWVETAEKVQGSQIFSDSRNGMYRPVEGEFESFDGAKIARSAASYRSPRLLTAKVDDFKAVQADVYQRRGGLKQAIAQTSDALRGADTDAQEKKLEAILSAQYQQMAAVDSEIRMSADEIKVQEAEAKAMLTAQASADAESRQALSREESQKIGTAFKTSSQSVLRNLKEAPFARD